MAQSRRQGLCDVQPPKNISEVRSFVGLANTFRDFIPNLSTIAKPITALCTKGTTFNWTSACQTAFQNIKAVAEQAPILHFPDPTQKLLLQTDASTQGIGAVLLQVTDTDDKLPICYESKAFNPTESNWSTIEQEAYAM